MSKREPTSKEKSDFNSKRPKSDDDIKKLDETLPYHFSDSELLEIAKDAAKLQNDLVAEEAGKNRVMADFKSRIAQLEEKISLASRQISSGYEHRKITCEAWLDNPKRGKKTITRLDTLEVVRVTDMSAEEMQRSLVLEEHRRAVTPSNGEAPEAEEAEATEEVES